MTENEKYLSPYDTGKRCEARLWGTPHDSASMAELPQIERDMIEARMGKVDFDDENGDSLFTVWVERNEQGARVVHIQQLGPTPVAIRIHGEDERG